MENENDREDGNRPHGHLVKQPPNVRYFHVYYYYYFLINIIICFSSLNRHE